MPDPVLIVLHQEHSTPGRIGHALKSRGYPLDIRRPRFGDPLPETLAGHTGAMVFGGPMSANDKDDFISREIDWLTVPLAESKPYLGICLGAQMLVRQLGGKVGPHPQGMAEIGYYPIRPTAAGQEFCDTWPSHVYQWHREGVVLPAGTELLAEGDVFAAQAFRHGACAFGIQFHPEVTHAMMCRWTTRGHDRMSLPGAKERAAHFADRAVYDFAIRAWLTDFLDRWLAFSAPVPRGGSGSDKHQRNRESVLVSDE
ncbi:MAG TPA: glutamine amidotransferase [Xanthobacteraceae bacterium]|jgi:GMP synthase (glutamine-hydrolysing)|nr:glutamine amidotransferase [Xanthobacteraceae bacterium]